MKLGERYYAVEKLYEDSGSIWSIEFLDANRILFTLNKSAEIKQFNLDNNLVELIYRLPFEVSTTIQGGLLDLEIDSKYSENNFVFFTYSKKMSNNLSTTAVGRIKLKNGIVSDFQEIFVAEPASPSSIHYGSRMVFDNDDKLFITVGDRGRRENAQDLTNHLGKVLRLNRDGSSPKDNPYYAHSIKKPEIWSFGHRNPQGIHYDKF